MYLQDKRGGIMASPCGFGVHIHFFNDMYNEEQTQTQEVQLAIGHNTTSEGKSEPDCWD